MHSHTALCIIVSFAALTLARPACETLSKYCSTGKVKGYVGPLDTAAQLKDALERTAHEREVILFGETRMIDASQALARFREAGWAHVLAVMERPAQCQQLQAVFQPWLESDGPISCGTYAISDEKGNDYPSRMKYLAHGVGQTAWWRKWFTAGRAVALGYNVLAVDSDVVVLGDWYWRVKQPPLSQFNMLSQSESATGINGGFSYIQNAASNGPVAWILYEAMHRAVRWAEDDSYLRNLTTDFFLLVDDQLLLRDAIFSAAAGRPSFAVLQGLFQKDESAFVRMGTTVGEFRASVYGPVNAAYRQKQTYNVSGELAGSVCEHFQQPVCNTTYEGAVVVSTVPLQMPHSGGKWPAGTGGYPFNRTAGPYTIAFREAYKELGVPLPPDPEDPATEAAARAVKGEQLGFLNLWDRRLGCTGCWAETGWWDSGRLGWWHLHLLDKTQQGKMAMGHVWAGLPPGDYQKERILMLSGLYNWHVAARLARSRQHMYFANQGHPLHQPEISVPVIRSVVAFAPGVIHATMSKADFVRAAQGLAQVAVSLGAIAAWPAAPCDADWALTAEARGQEQRPIRHRIPWTYLDTFFQVQPFGDSLSDLQCEWPGFAATGCITLGNMNPDGGRGMLAMEFHHLRTSTRAVPGPQTTLQLGNISAPPPANTVGQRVPHADLLRLNAHAVFSRLQHEQMPVFWLDRLVDVTDMAAEAADTYGRWRGRCMGLSYLEMPEGQHDRW